MRTTLFVSLSLLAALAMRVAYAQAPSLVVEYDLYGGIGRATTVRVMSNGSIERSETGLARVSSAPVHAALRPGDLAQVRAAVGRVRALHFAPPTQDGSQSETFKFEGGTQVWFGAHPPSAVAALVRLLLHLAPPPPRPDPFAPPPEPAFS